MVDARHTVHDYCCHDRMGGGVLAGWRNGMVMQDYCCCDRMRAVLLLVDQMVDTVMQDYCCCARMGVDQMVGAELPNLCQFEGHGYTLHIHHESRIPSTTLYKVHLHSMLQTQQGKLQIIGISTAAVATLHAANAAAESLGFLPCQRQAAPGWRPT